MLCLLVLDGEKVRSNLLACAFSFCIYLFICFDKTIGVASGFYKRKPTDFFSFGYGDNFVDIFYLSTFGIDKAYQKQGIGSVLFKYLLKILDEDGAIDLIDLHVKDLNETASNFYTKLGFEITKRKPNHYEIGGKRYNALKMVFAKSKKGKDFVVEQKTTLVKRVYTFFGCPYNDALDELIMDEKQE